MYNIQWKTQATTQTEVVCSPTGDFLYPAAWEQCSARVWCPDPGNSSTVSRVYRDWAGTGDWRAVRQFHNLEYASVLEYTCDDSRQVARIVIFKQQAKCVLLSIVDQVR